MAENTEPCCEIVLYQTEDDRTRPERCFMEETLWLTQAIIEELYQVGIPTKNQHLKISIRTLN